MTSRTWSDDTNDELQFFFLVRCYFPNVSSLCETTSFFVQVLLLNVSQFKRDPTGKDDMKQPSGPNSGRVVRALALQ